MAYITAPELRERLPLDGEGISNSEIDEAIASAVEYVVELTNDANGDSAVSKNAVAKFAHADVLDLVFPRDARDRDSASVIMRENAELILSRYLEAKADPDDDPLTIGTMTAHVEYPPWG
jgi:hypothetical protein